MKRILEAGALVFRSENGQPRILLVRAKKNPAHWIFPKGHIEAGETSSEAAVREVEEEAGVKGIALTALEPLLEFQSGDEAIRVQYHLIAATGNGVPSEQREAAWLAPAEAFERLSFADARDLLRRALPLIQPAIDYDAEAVAGDKVFQALLEAEYAHAAESLLRNEEDGERRVTFLITISGGVAAALGLVLGKDTVLRADEPQPLILFALLILVGLGYLTFMRVITRNAASDRYKRALNRIRRFFVSSDGDPRVRFLPFDPYRVPRRSPLARGSIGTGGWLPTVIFVNALVLGALAAAICSSGNWYVNGAVGALVMAVAWVTLVDIANREYARVARKAGDDIVPQPGVFSRREAKRFLAGEGFEAREESAPPNSLVNPHDPPEDQMFCVLEGSLHFDFPTLPDSITLPQGRALFVPRALATVARSETGARYLVAECSKEL